LSIAEVPCHSQAVERAIKEVTRASTKAFGHAARHGKIVSAEKSRKKYKKMEAKKDFLTDDDQLSDIKGAGQVYVTGFFLNFSVVNGLLTTEAK